MNLFEKQQNEFTGRHIGTNEPETVEMLAAIGVSSIDELISKTIPDSIRIKGPLSFTGCQQRIPVPERPERSGGKEQSV